MIPDVKVNAQNALFAARELIFKNQMLAAKAEKEKYKTEFYLHTVLLEKQTQNPPLSILSQLTGTYPDVTIYLNKGKLLCRNNDDKSVSELKLTADNRFKIDNNAQIEFLKNNKGQFSSIKIYLSDGNVFEQAKKTISNPKSKK